MVGSPLPGGNDGSARAYSELPYLYPKYPPPPPAHPWGDRLGISYFFGGGFGMLKEKPFYR